MKIDAWTISYLWGPQNIKAATVLYSHHVYMHNLNIMSYVQQQYYLQFITSSQLIITKNF